MVDSEDIEKVVRRATEANVQLVAFMYCDNAGVIRSKSTHIANLASRMRSGIGYSTTMQAMMVLDHILPFEGMTVVGEFRLMPDPKTFRVLPYDPRSAYMVGDMVTLDGKPYAACPREFLKRMCEQAREEMGFTLQASFEPEWTLATKEDGRVVPIDRTVAYSTIGMIPTRQLIHEMVDALVAQDIGVDIFHSEGGPGQQEITVHHTNAVRAADNHLMYRETIRNIAWQHGYFASFAPKVAADHHGNGAHLHFSAWDAESKRNMFYASDDPYALSETAYHFLGGVLEHMPGLLAMTAPSVNSYRRLGAKSWSCAYIAYGPDNREAAVRVPSTLWGREQESVNFELKPTDSSCNPYIALGGVLAAGMDGIKRKLMPPEGLRVDVDPSTLSQKERDARGIKPLPENLAQAADALEKDKVLMAAMGPTLASSYITVRRGEAKLFAGHDAAFEFDQHFFRY